MNAKSSISELLAVNRQRILGCLLCLTVFCPLIWSQGHPDINCSHLADTLSYIVKTDTLIVMEYDTIWLSAQQTEANKEETEGRSRYDRRIHRYRKHWEALIPTHTKLQFAGNMGLLSIGTGWDYGKRNQWETDILFGFLPKYESKRAKVTFTLKQNYIPWSISIKDGPWSIEPLACGIYFNTVFGDEFWVNEPERYPKGYYGFSSKVRIHAFLGQRITWVIPPHLRIGTREVTWFYELSTSDLYLISAFTNKYLKPRDYLSLSFGIKLRVF